MYRKRPNPTNSRCRMNARKPEIQVHTAKDALFFVRVVALSALAVIAAAVGIYRYYFVTKPPMVVPAEDREIPAPTLEK